MPAAISLSLPAVIDPLRARHALQPTIPAERGRMWAKY